KRLHGLIGSFLKSIELKEQITMDIEKYVLDFVKNWKDGQLVYIQDETKKEENMKLKKSKEEKKELVTWSDYMSLPFTQDVITKTLHLRNIITGVMQKTLQDFEVKGHFIPKGWCVFMYFKSIHLDEDLYDSPYKFNPWRWQ
ncbi:hypothetical protein KI387_021617, partial [Taxus chinensis]